MLAKDVMRTRVIAASMDAPVYEVARHLALGGFSGLPVVDRDYRLIGVVSATDVIRAIAANQDLRTLRANQVMSADPVTVEEADHIDDVIRRLAEYDIGRVFVLRCPILVGVISRTDILGVLFEPRLLTVVGE